MTRTKIIFRRALFAALALAAPLAWFGLARGAGEDVAAEAKPAAAQTDKHDQRYMGSAACALCHANPTPRFETDLVKLNEYGIWADDKITPGRCFVDTHHLAYSGKHCSEPDLIQLSGLTGDRAHDIEQLMNWPAGYAVKRESGCLNCHAMNLAPEQCDPSLRADDKRLAEFARGVTCEACHGASSAWIDKHWKRAEWRDNANRTAEEKRKLGFVNVRDPIERTELCLSCHVGNIAEGKLVTHEMFAAGHPPLPPLEVESFLDKMPPHWKSAAERTDPAVQKYVGDHPLARTQAVLLEGLLDLRTSLRLLAEAADPTRASPPATGGEPNQAAVSIHAGLNEFAIYDCAACHHELIRPSQWESSLRQARGYGDFAPGRPALRCYWTLPLARVGLDEANLGDAKDQTTIDSLLAPLASATRQGPFGDPAVVGPAARQVVAELNKQIDKLRAEKDLQPEAAKRLLEQLREIRKQALDENSERQLDAAIQIITAELSKAAK